MKVVIAGNEIIVKSELLQEEISFLFHEKKQADAIFPIVKRVVDFVEKQEIELVAQIDAMLDLPEVTDEDV